MALRKVVTGGQTGVDRAALDAAQAAGLPVGGWCPAGRRAEDGVIPARYPLRETPSPAYAQRTAWNVRDSDGTLVLTPGPAEGGTALTLREARQRNKPLLHVKLSELRAGHERVVASWVEAEGIAILNVAGPRASEAPGIYRTARAFLEAVFCAAQEEGGGALRYPSSS